MGSILTTACAKYPPKKGVLRVMVMCSIGECPQQGHTHLLLKPCRYFVCIKREEMHCYAICITLSQVR